MLCVVDVVPKPLGAVEQLTGGLLSGDYYYKLRVIDGAFGEKSCR